MSVSSKQGLDAPKQGSPAVVEWDSEPVKKALKTVSDKCIDFSTPMIGAQLQQTTEAIHIAHPCFPEVSKATTDAAASKINETYKNCVDTSVDKTFEHPCSLEGRCCFGSNKKKS